MLETLVEPTEPLVLVEEEPELALPQIFTQPPCPVVLKRGKLPDVERLVGQLYQEHLKSNGTGALGPDYQALVQEFQPLFLWAMACWDYVLSTQGCRFVLRSSHEKLVSRGDYRAVTDRDYSRLVHRIFRSCVFEYAQQMPVQSISSYLRAHFWDGVLEAYARLADPPDIRQRPLTAYSYLRCVPYRFLNPFHQELVHRELDQVPAGEAQAVSFYFLHFFTLQATADRLTRPLDAAEALLRQTLVSLLRDQRLVYCLLRQIERY